VTVAAAVALSLRVDPERYGAVRLDDQPERDPSFLLSASAETPCERPSCPR
jgi:hypothetical protein